jgi:hypothetical protein
VLLNGYVAFKAAVWYWMVPFSISVTQPAIEDGVDGLGATVSAAS